MDGLPRLKYDKVYAFDPIRVPEWDDAKWDSYDANIQFFECAMGDAQGVASLAMTDNPEARTLVMANENFSGSDKKRVKVIDFSAWLKANVRFEDTIVVKMDIEGAEYGVLEKLIHDKTIDYINHLFVEWHDRLMREDQREQFTEREAKIREACKIPIQHWV